MKVCQICKKEGCNKLIDFGKHPVCHKFTNGNEKEEKYPLTLGQCQFCGVAQLMSPIPINGLIPQYDWITYNEPEEHLDHLAEVIKNLPGITKKSAICGISYKEDTMLTRLNRLGFNDTWRLNMKEDLLQKLFFLNLLRGGSRILDPLTRGARRGGHKEAAKTILQTRNFLFAWESFK